MQKDADQALRISIPWSLTCSVKKSGAMFGPLGPGHLGHLQILLQRGFFAKGDLASLESQHLLSHGPGVITKPDRQWHAVAFKSESMLCHLETV